MRIHNVHHRSFRATATELGAMLDNLSSDRRSLWPKDNWPPMQFETKLGFGARGGHGPIRYTVTEHERARRVVFAFDASTGIMRGVEGTHCFAIEGKKEDGCVGVSHTIEARATNLRAWLSWYLLVRPLHDALIEDGFDQVEAHLEGRAAETPRWNWAVRTLRRLVRRRPHAS